MSYVFPYYTAVYTAVLGLLAALLTVNVIVNRVRAKVDFADGGQSFICSKGRGIDTAVDEARDRIRRRRCPSLTRRSRHTIALDGLAAQTEAFTGLKKEGRTWLICQ